MPICVGGSKTIVVFVDSMLECKSYTAELYKRWLERVFSMSFGWVSGRGLIIFLRTQARNNSAHVRVGRVGRVRARLKLHIGRQAITEWGTTPSSENLNDCKLRKHLNSGRTRICATPCSVRGGSCAQTAETLLFMENALIAMLFTWS